MKFNTQLGTYQLINDNAADLTTYVPKMWDPSIEFRNQVSSPDVDNLRIYIFNDGTIV